MPSLLVYDQPSQVYFPKRLADKPSETATEKDLPLKDEDVEALKKVFNVFSRVVGEEKGNLQIIVLDHAPESIWGSIPNTHCVAEWREGKKLVPDEWLA